MNEQHDTDKVIEDRRHLIEASRPSRRVFVFGVVLLALAVIAITLTGAVTEKATCEAKGGKRLRGTWAWEGFKCYDASTLKVLP